MTKIHYIIIQTSIIEDIEKVIKLPEEYKSKIKELCLSGDMLNIKLANEILNTLDIIYDIKLIRSWNNIINTGSFVIDPLRNVNLILK